MFSNVQPSNTEYLEHSIVDTIFLRQGNVTWIKKENTLTFGWIDPKIFLNVYQYQIPIIIRIMISMYN